MMDCLYLDYETFPICPGMQAPPPVVASFAWNDDAPEILHANFDERKLERLLWDAIRNPNVRIIAHNVKFEFLVSLAWRSAWVEHLASSLDRGAWYCTLEAEKLIRIASGDRSESWGLDDLCAQYGAPFVPDKSNPWRARFGELWGVPVKDFPEEAKRYSLGDICVREVYKAQIDSITPDELHYLHDLPNQVWAAVALGSTSAWGFPTDPWAAEKLLQQTIKRLDAYRDELLGWGWLGQKKEKGQVKLVRSKAPAEAEVKAAYAAMGREPPRAMPTPKMLQDAYAQAGIKAPQFRAKKLQKRDLDRAIDDGVPAELFEGNLRLDEEICLASGSPKLLAYTRYGQANTLLGKVRRLKNPLIQCRYNTLVATGRASCSQGDDPEPGEPWVAYGIQVQNLPRAGEEWEDEEGKKHSEPGARECFIAHGFREWLATDLREFSERELADQLITLPPDHCIVSVDLDAAEMRAWAQVCLWILGYSDLAEILNNPKRCPHIEMGTLLRHQTNDQAQGWEQKFAWGYGLKKSDKKLLKEVRNLAKGPNFGLPGGMGWQRLQDYCRVNYGVPLTQEEAQFACAAWRSMYREAQPYLDWVKDQIGSAYGSRAQIEQFVSKRVRGDVGFTDASNGFFQALIADAMKVAAGRALWREAYCNIGSPFYGARPLAFVHDEWLYSVPRARLHEAGHRMRDVILEAVQPYCPDVLMSASPAASYRWTKAAGDPYYLKGGKLSSFEEGGELIPYEEHFAYKESK